MEQVESVLVVTKLLANYFRKKIKLVLEGYFPSPLSINPFMEDKALIKLSKNHGTFPFMGKWKGFEDLHLKIDNWSNQLHSTSNVI